MSDNAEYCPDGGAAVDVAPRGADSQQTAVNAGREDRDAAESEVSGRIPQRACSCPSFTPPARR
jgi:hypothetical protein